MRKDMHNPENPDTARPGWRTILGGTVVLLLLVILGYVGYQILHLLNPPNTYETVLTATVEDKVEAEGVVLFQETLIPWAIWRRTGPGSRQGRWWPKSTPAAARAPCGPPSTA